MTKEEVTKFLQNNSVAYIATSSNNIPTVRVMQILSIDEKSILFNTKAFKQSYKDLCKNSNIEICFYNHISYEQIRVYGNAVEIKNDKIRKEIVKNYPQLNTLVQKEGLEVIKPFEIINWQYKLTNRH